MSGRRRVGDPERVKNPTPFSDTIRHELTRHKKFRKPDGSLIETSELELITLKLIRELRMTTPVNSRLLDIVLNRMEGRAKEIVEIEGGLEVSNGNLSDEELISIIRRLGGTAESENSS